MPCNTPPWQTAFFHFRYFRHKGAWLLLCVARAERAGVDSNIGMSGELVVIYALANLAVHNLVDKVVDNCQFTTKRCG